MNPKAFFGPLASFMIFASVAKAIISVRVIKVLRVLLGVRLSALYLKL